MLQIGAGIQDITAYRRGLPLMGWAKHGNVAQGVASPLFARAFVFKDAAGHKLAFVSAEICFVTQSIQQGVIAELARLHAGLGFHDANVMLTATHTHCGPGGYSHHVLYTMIGGGYIAEVKDTIVSGIVAAIVQADRAAMPAHVQVASDHFPVDQRVAFNRSLKAHNANPEVSPKFKPDERHKAVDREMTLVRFSGAGGEAIGCVNWFAVHPINVHNDVNLISSDNKGHAATVLETTLKQRSAAPVVAAFAQGASGDVSPNFQVFPGLPMLRGEFPDDFASMRYNGDLQAALALSLYDRAADGHQLSAELDAVLMYVDMGRVEIPADLAGGEVGHRTAPAAIGVRMLQGTEEGPGISAALADLAGALSTAVVLRERVEALWQGSAAHQRVFEKHRAHGNKAIAIETGERRVFGFSDLRQFIVPAWLDPTIAHLKELYESGALGDKPWTPQVVPLQIFVIGELAIIALPCEMTTQAGRRLRETVGDVLAERGVSTVLISCYANAYSGYVTTREEYDVQDYEGASTHFGRWTLAAYQAKLRDLATNLLVGSGPRRVESGVMPPVFGPEELARRAYPHG